MTSTFAPPRLDERASATWDPPRPPSQPRRRRIDPVLTICALGAVLLALDVGGALSAALLGIAIVLVPGVFVVDIVAARGAAERFILTCAVSITSWMIVAHVLLSLQWWAPRGASAVCLAAAAGVRWRQQRGRRDAPSALQHLLDFSAGLDRRQIGWSAIGLAFWLVSLPFIDFEGLDNWGLITAVPPMFFVGYAIALVVAATTAMSTTATSRRLVAALAPLLLMIYGTVAFMVPTIRYPWAYKHLGVIRLLDETGRLHGDVDIYNNFSGFFGLGALVRGATGVDPVSYAAWTQLVAESFILVAVWLLIRRATDSERVAHLATVLYLITDWVGQNYFGAQTLGTFLSLSTMGLAISWFLHGETRRLQLVGRSIARMAPNHSALVKRGSIGFRRAVVLFVFLGLMMTHPLTPAATLGALTLAWVVGWIRDRRLIVGLYAVAMLWAVRSIAYFAAQDFDLGFGGSVSGNAGGNVDYSDAPSAVVIVGDLTKFFSLTVWLLAVIGAVLCVWAMRRVGMLVVAACVPFGIPLVQSYGGEAVYRVYLYSLPLMVGFAAWGIATRSPISGRTRMSQSTLLAVLVCLTLGAGFLVAHFGRERINNVSLSEVAMGEHIAATVDDPAVMAQFFSSYPAASSARYPSFQVNDTYVPEIVEMLGPTPTLPPPDALDDVADDLYGLEAGVPHVIVSPGMIDSLAQSGEFPVSSTADAVAFLTTNERFVVVHRIDDTWLLKVLP